MKYAVVDLEMCQVPKLYRKGYRYSVETIQIGAVLMDEEFSVIDSFMTYVRPEYGMITNVIQKLTGITKRDVACAPVMREALRQFADWLPEDTVLVSWSNSDPLQIQHERECKQIDFPGIEKLDGEWLDCQRMFGNIIRNLHQYNLVEAMNLSDIDYDDDIHDGLVDAGNTALLFRKMMTEEEFQFNKYFKMAMDTEDVYGQIGA